MKLHCINYLYRVPVIELKKRPKQILADLRLPSVPEEINERSNSATKLKDTARTEEPAGSDVIYTSFTVPLVLYGVCTQWGWTLLL